jgi:hypothetical protein
VEENVRLAGHFASIEVPIERDNSLGKALNKAGPPIDEVV